MSTIFKGLTKQTEEYIGTKIIKLSYMKSKKQNKPVELISINSEMRDFCFSELS